MYKNAAAVGAVAQREGIPYLLDATQSVGQMPIDVQQLGYDYLVSTGRKIPRVPQKTGLLYASRWTPTVAYDQNATCHVYYPHFSTG